MSQKLAKKQDDQRPFLAFWDYLEDFEMKRRSGKIPDDRHLMTLGFIETIGPEKFLQEARQVHALMEIGRFYGSALETPDDLAYVLKKLESNLTHQEIFYYSFYFAAWIKPEVPLTQRRFQTFDERIRYRIEEGGSLQSLLRDLVQIIGYLKFRRYFETMGINRVHLFMDYKQVHCLDDLTRLDDLECRHLLDQLVMKTGLEQMRFADVQQSLGHQPLSTDQRSWYKPPPCLPED